MSVAVSRHQRCRLCGSELELALSLAPTPVGEKLVPRERLNGPDATYPLDLGLCRGCGHAQLLDVIHPELLYADYIYESMSSLGLAEHFQRYADEVLARVAPASGSLIVDIGSNDGTLLKGFKASGLCVLGVDPARAIAQKTSAAGIETLPAFFTPELARRIRMEYGPATIVTANNVFANIDHLIELVGAIRGLLAPEGVFVFETSYLTDVLQKTLLETCFHEHLSYFSVKPLEAFFRRQGMVMIAVDRVPTKGGSIRGTVQLAGGRRPISPSVAELLVLETRLGVQRPESFQAFAATIDRVKHQLLGLLRQAAVQGKTVAGYGATVGGVTLTYQFELGPLLRFLVDDNPRRQHLFSPGHHLPVLSPEALLERKPDYVLILAPGYAEPIIQKRQAYLKQGGCFIVPLPSMRVIGEP